MAGDISIESKAAEALSGPERTAWGAFRAARPELASPYFDFRYALAASREAPGAAVAVVRRGERIEAFFPFQRRGGLIQPLGAPLTDYHGLIARPGAAVDLRALVRALGASRFRFSGLIGPAAKVRSAAVRAPMVADLSRGYEAWARARQAAGQGAFLKDKRRRARRLAAEHGEVDFTLEAGDAETLELILKLKSDQMLRTGQHDIFSAPWTRALLRRLAAETDPDFGLRFAVLRAGERIIAAELGLQSGRAYHLWFPIYDPEFARYSPGALMTLATLETLAARDVVRVDFGPDEEGYKRAFAEPAGAVLEGSLEVGAVSSVLGQAADALMAAAPLGRAVGSARLRLDRRIDRITACEPGAAGAQAAWKSLGQIGRKHSKITMGAGLGLAVLGLALAAE